MPVPRAAADAAISSQIICAKSRCDSLATSIWNCCVCIFLSVTRCKDYNGYATVLIYEVPPRRKFIAPIRMLWMGYQRRTQKGMGRKGKIPNVSGTKTQRLNTAGAARAIDMVRFFDISVKISFLVKSLTVQKKPFFLIMGRFILKINNEEAMSYEL